MLAHLLMNHRTQPCLSLDDGIWNPHLSTQSRQKNHQFNGVHVVGNQDKRSFLVLNQAHNVIQPILDHVGLLADILLFLSLRDSSRLLVQALLLLSLGLWSVLVEELESLSREISV